MNVTSYGTVLWHTLSDMPAGPAAALTRSLTRCMHTVTRPGNAGRLPGTVPVTRVNFETVTLMGAPDHFFKLEWYAKILGPASLSVLNVDSESL